MHMQPDEAQIIGIDQRQGLIQILMPDTMLTVLATGIGLLTMTMPETGIDAQPDRMAGRTLPQLTQHVA